MSAVPSLQAVQKVVSGPAGSGAFGTAVAVLPNGNFVVTDPQYAVPGSPNPVGAVYLYDGATLGVISALTGAGGNGGNGGNAVSVSAGVRTLPNGNFVILSPGWGEGRGAVTWGSGTTGISGEVSAANSLVGSDTKDAVGGQDIVILPNGNYVVRSAWWNDRRGAATWGRGDSGVSGEVSESNSLVGAAPGEWVGSAVTVLRNGNYVVHNPNWNETRGAVTWGSGTEGATGTISPANSLVGSAVKEYVGGRGQETAVVQLPGGDFVVLTPSWGGGRGAVTWVRGTEGLAGEISAANSLVGSGAGDHVGGNWLTILTNGNYVVPCPRWNENRGAAVWANGTLGITGEVSEANALVGGTAGSGVGMGATALTNGNYVVGSHLWSDGRGASTLANGATGTTGVVSASNSLVGSRPGDGVGASYNVTALNNGNYVLVSSEWNDGRGAVTWGSGTDGVTGVVSSANSLVGSGSTDYFGNDGVIALANGNYVVGGANWNAARGAVAWGSGVAGVKGVVSSSNSLVGSSANDQVGGFGIVELDNGNYVVASANWNGKRGAVTWSSGASGISGTVSASNSLVGSRANDMVGKNGVIPVGNGNYVFISNDWNNNFGAVTWGDGAKGVKGVVSAANSVTGGAANEFQDFGVTLLTNGNYVLRCPGWNGRRGAVIWQNGNAGSTGTLSSLAAGALRDDGSPPSALGQGEASVIPLSNGNYLVSNALWNGGRGAVTWGSGTEGVSGTVSDANSVAGIGDPTLISILSDGNYLMQASHWPAGALVFGNGAQGAAGAISTVNAVVGNSLRQAQSGFAWSYDAPRSRLVTGYAPGNWLSLLDFTPAPALPPRISLIANGLEIAHGDTTPSAEDNTDFGGVAYFQKKAHRFTIRNRGAGPLHLPDRGISFSLYGNENHSFSVTVPPEDVVPPGGSTTFEVTYAPRGFNNEALMSILSDDSTQGSWSFAIAGKMLSPLQGWRERHFGNITGEVGNLDDFDHDGVSNMMEFSFGTLPGDSTSGPEALEYSGPLAGGGTVVRAGMPTVLVERTADKVEMRAVWCRRSDQGARCTPQFSSDLVNWVDIFLQPSVLADDGNAQIVGMPFPDLGYREEVRFFRVKVDSPE